MNNEKIINKNPYERLKNTGVIDRIIEQNQLDIKIIDSEPDNIKTALEVIKSYNKLPIIIDADGRFNHHAERRAWRDTLDKETRAIYEANALRGNSLSNVTTALYLMAIQLKTDGEEEVSNEIMSEYEYLIVKIKSGWDYSEENPNGRFTIEQKVDFIQTELAETVKSAYQVVIEKYRTNS